MDVQSLTFGLKDVVAIAVGVSGAAGFIWAMKNADDKNKIATDSLRDSFGELETKLTTSIGQIESSKKSDMEDLYREINKTKEEIKEKESKIYDEMSSIKKEQRESHDKMATKLDTVATQLSTINMGLAELTGYIKGQKERGK